MKLYVWLGILVCAVALAYFFTDAFVKYVAYKNPEKEIVFVNRTKVRNNVVTRERIVEKPGGERVIERVTEDRTMTETEERGKENTRIAFPPRASLIHLLVLTPAMTPGSRVIAGADVSLGGFSLGAAHEVLPLPGAFAPMVYVRIAVF